MLSNILDKIALIFYVPAGLGVLAFMLAAEKEEPWGWRLIGLAVGTLLLPWLLLLGLWFAVQDIVEHVRS